MAPNRLPPITIAVFVFIILALGLVHFTSALQAGPLPPEGGELSAGNYICFWALKPAPPLKEGCNLTGNTCGAGFEPNPPCSSFTTEGECNGSPQGAINRVCKKKSDSISGANLPPQKTSEGIVGATSWKLCADEGGTCSFQGNKATAAPKDVAYGAYEKGVPHFNYIYGIPAAAGGIKCNNDNFKDPVKVDKQCFRRDSDIEALSDLAPQAGFTFCAPEGYTCTSSGIQDIAYGVESHFSYLIGMTAGTIECSNDTSKKFSDTSDPAKGKNKYCFKRASDIPKLSSDGPGGGYVFCARENQPCSFSGTANIKYGADGKFNEKSGVTGPIDCTNSNFGDPIHKDKACYLTGNNPLGTNPPPGTNPLNLSIQNPLQVGTIPEILGEVSKFLFNIGLAFVTIMVLWGGFQILTAAGNPSQIDKGKQTLLWAIIGTVIILIAGGIAKLIENILGGPS